MVRGVEEGIAPLTCLVFVFNVLFESVATRKDIIKYSFPFFRTGRRPSRPTDRCYAVSGFPESCVGEQDLLLPLFVCLVLRDWVYLHNYI